MTSSGIKRGVAATAISALAVAGLPLLAGTASATPNAAQSARRSRALRPASSRRSSPPRTTAPTPPSRSWPAAARSVRVHPFQYHHRHRGDLDQTSATVARNDDGVFALDVDRPARRRRPRVRAVANTGERPTPSRPSSPIADAVNTVELATEGRAGCLPGALHRRQRGTAGADRRRLRRRDRHHVDGRRDDRRRQDREPRHRTGTDDARPTPTARAPAPPDTFQASSTSTATPYSGGTRPTRSSLGAATDNTDDAEGSTLYVQTIGSITADPATQEDADPERRHGHPDGRSTPWQAGRRCRRSTAVATPTPTPLAPTPTPTARDVWATPTAMARSTITSGCRDGTVTRTTSNVTDTRHAHEAGIDPSATVDGHDLHAGR